MILIILILIGVVALWIFQGYSRKIFFDIVYLINFKKLPHPISTEGAKITVGEARSIAKRDCLKPLDLLGSLEGYNKITKTWWFTLNLFDKKPLCNPVCVVKEETKTAEINWQCTGAIIE